MLRVVNNSDGGRSYQDVGFLFGRFTRWIERQVGKPLTFLLAVLLIVVWGVSYPLFNSFDTYQLVVNTVTTIITFLMVFIIQNTQTRDTQAIQIKLDELIRATANARNSMMHIEDLSETEIEHIRKALLRHSPRNDR